MGGDSESAFKNTPIQISSIPLGPFHKNFLKIWASDLVGALIVIYCITIISRLEARCVTVSPRASNNASRNDGEIGEMHR